MSVPVALLTTSIRVAISEQAVYDYSVRTYDASSMSGIPQSELLRANTELRSYLTARDPGPLTVKVRNAHGQMVPLFNARETAHMADVRDLVQAMFAVQILAATVALSLAVAMLVMWPPRALAAAALYGAVLTGGVLGTAGLVAMSGFGSAWDQFHVIAFSNDLWQLDPDTDHLIQMFPESFWEKITIILGGATLLEAGLLGAISSIYLFVSRPRGTGELAIVPEPPLAGPAGHSRPVAPTKHHPYVH